MGADGFFIGIFANDEFFDVDEVGGRFFDHTVGLFELFADFAILFFDAI